MKNHNSRLAKLETKPSNKRPPRLIVLDDGIYYERGQVLAEAEYKTIAEDRRFDVTLCEIVRTEKQIGEQKQ
jgi:hypothetical protein